MVSVTGARQAKPLVDAVDTLSRVVSELQAAVAANARIASLIAEVNVDVVDAEGKTTATGVTLHVNIPINAKDTATLLNEMIAVAQGNIDAATNLLGRIS